MPLSKIGWPIKLASQQLAHLEAPQKKAAGVCASLNSPCQTAISGYAGLLRSLRSNVVGPHTHSCRLLSDVSLQDVREQRFLRFTRRREFPFARKDTLFAAQMVGASSRQHRSEATGGGQRTHQRGGFSKRSGGQMGRHQKSAQKNWNLTPINSMLFGRDLQRHQDAGDHVVGGDGGGQFEHFCGRKMAGQLLEQSLINSHIDGHLGGVLQHQTL